MKRKPRKSERGSAIVEFAIGWSILWAMFAGVYEIGYSYYVYNSIMTSVANAAELGAKLNYDTTTPSTYTNAIKNMVVYGDETAGTTPIVPNLTTAMVTVNVTTSGSASIPRDLTVYINGYTINALFATFSLTTKPRATAAYYGQVSCSGC
jgi:Flp pilus assembly protein TadG